MRSYSLNGGANMFGTVMRRRVGSEKGMDANAREVFHFGEIQAGQDDKRGRLGGEMLREQRDEAMARDREMLVAATALDGVHIYEHRVIRLVVWREQQLLP